MSGSGGCSEKVVAIHAQALIAALHMSQAETNLAEREDGPVAARWLAPHLGLSTKNVETLRRRVRDAADHARQHGHMVCANGEGYWLARDVAEYTAYEESRNAKTKFAFVRRKKRQRAVSEKNTGQGLLMEVAPYATF